MLLPRQLSLTVVRRLAAPCLALLLVLAFSGLLWACPTCKDGLAQHDPAGMNLARGYYWSILFMMAMPFLLLSGLGSYFYYEIRRARARQAALGAGPAMPPLNNG
ncbi:MAG: hypothetical protein J5I93_12610 [Pirellulaceae bacterium]|nr:hypothetical protein [Pirellulaceae bacterium]